MQGEKKTQSTVIRDGISTAVRGKGKKRREKLSDLMKKESRCLIFWRNKNRVGRGGGKDSGVGRGPVRWSHKGQTRAAPFLDDLGGTSKTSPRTDHLERWTQKKLRAGPAPQRRE